MTSKANSGFVADSGVQKHSAGDHFPITCHHVGDWPRRENNGYFVVSHPSGVKRWCYTSGYRDNLIQHFVDADEAINDLDLNVVSERVAVELYLHGLERRGDEFCGHKLDENGKGGY